MTEVEVRKLSLGREDEVRMGLNKKFAEYAGFKAGDIVYIVHEPGLMIITKDIKDIVVR